VSHLISFPDLNAYAEHVDPIESGEEHDDDDILGGEDDGYESDYELTAATTFERINPGQSWHLFFPTINFT
jgi:hypothetical protein